MTTFTRNASGDLITITSADGQDTTVMLHANGYLAALTNPELETTSFTFTTDDLMLTKADAREFHRSKLESQGIRSELLPEVGFCS